MKYLFFTVLALALLIFAGVRAVLLVNGLRRKHGKPPLERGGRAAAFLAAVLSLAVLAGAGYFCAYYHGEEGAYLALESDDGVTVTEVPEGFFLDGQGTQDALVFFPGAKVEAEAYAPLMRRLAEEWVDVLLVEPPLHVAFFSSGKAASFMEAHPYERWYLAGHSLGGVTASGLAAKRGEETEGLILLASYPTGRVPDSVRLLSIYGDQDGVLNLGAYEEKKENWPENCEEHVIPGGNHAGFGNYGPQKGDGSASISAEVQQRETAEKIIEFIGRN